MKPTAAIIAVAALAALVLDCRSEPSRQPKQSAAPAATPHWQRLTTAMISDPRTFNPIVAADPASEAAIGEIFEPLVRLNPATGRMEPHLARRWECTPQGTACTFFLRDDIRWQDGVPLVAEDVIFTFDAVYDQLVPNRYKQLLTIDGKPLEASALDSHTVRILLPQAFAPLLHMLGSLPIIPRHLLGDTLAAGSFSRWWATDTAPANLIGTGPYRMTKYLPGRSVELRRNPDYWMRDEAGRALPYIEERSILIVPSQERAYLEFVAGRTDIHECRPGEVSELRRKAGRLGIRVQKIGLDTGQLFVTFNRNPRHYRKKKHRRNPRLAWFTDKRFLSALAHAVDKQAVIAGCLHGHGRPAVTAMPLNDERFHNAPLTDYAYDLDLARRILDEAGYRIRKGENLRKDPKGNAIEFTLYTNAGNETREKIASILQQNWAELGIRVNEQAVDSTLLVEKLEDTYDWDAVLIGFTGSIDPHDEANLLRSDGRLHLWRPRQTSPATAWETEIDRLVDASARELDPDKRRQTYQHIRQILHDELPMIPVVRPMRFIAYKRALKNFRPTVWGIYRPEMIRFSR